MNDDPACVALASAERLALLLAGVPDQMAFEKLSEVDARIIDRLTPVEGSDIAEALSKRFIAYVVARKALIENVGFTRTHQ